MARVLDKEEQDIRRDVENKRHCTVYNDDPRVFKVDKILDIRAITTEIEYCVKWTGYTAKHNEWVAERDVTPELRRKFLIEKKKKEIKLLKGKKAKARLMRKKHGRMANGLISTTLVVPSTSLHAKFPVTSTPAADYNGKGTSLSVSLADESEPQIPEWITPKEDNEDSDASLSDYSEKCELEVTKWTASKQENEGSDTASSESDECGMEAPKRSTSQRDNDRIRTCTGAK